MAQHRIPERGTLFPAFLLLFSKNIIRADVIVFAKLQQVVDRQFVGAALIPGVHCLAGLQDIRDFLLGLIRINAKVPDDFYIIKMVSTKTSMDT